MNSKRLLDSSVWIEIFRSGPLSAVCEKELKTATEIIVPALVIYEVYKKILTSTTEDQALSAIALMSEHTVLDLNKEIALSAADISVQHDLGMADSLILSSALFTHSLLITLDNDFSGLPSTKVLR